MSRILAIDYGAKRTGFAMTDPLRIIASPLETVPTHKVWEYLKKLIPAQEVGEAIVGMPVDWNDADTHATPLVRQFIAKFQKEFPDISLTTVDERFSSRMAKTAMLDMGMKKKERRQKENVDKIAAAIMLQEFLDRHV